MNERPLDEQERNNLPLSNLEGSDTTDESFELVGPPDIAEAIRQLNEDELRFLNRLIVERLKLIAQARNTAMLARFSVGDRVSFTSPSGERKAGAIVRLNKKTASITTDDGQRWNVHPSYLSSTGTEIIEPPGEPHG